MAVGANESPAKLARTKVAHHEEARATKKRDYEDDDDESERISIEDGGVIGHTGARALDLYTHINWNPG